MKNTFLLILLITSTILHAQVRSEMGFSGNSMKAADLGSKGMILFSKQNTSFGVAMFSSDGSKLWEQTIEFKKAFWYSGCASPDGTTFYFSVQGKGMAKGSVDSYTIGRIQVADGTMETKEHAKEKDSNPISSYATNTAFYLVTSPQDWNFEKKTDYTTNLLRFDGKTLDCTTTSAEMNIVNEKEKIFWELYKVEQSYVEGYRVVSQEGSTVQLEFARFDTTGKKVFSKMTDLKLEQGAPVPNNTSEKTYKSIGNFVHIRTHISTSDNGTGEVVINPMGFAQLLYDDESNTILIYGIMGPAAAKNRYPNCEGYFVAKMDTNYKIASILERPKESLIAQSVLGDVSKERRYCDGFIHPGNRFGLHIGGLKTDLLAIVDITTMTHMSLTKIDWKGGGNGNRYMPDMQKNLLHNSTIIKEESHYSGSALFCNNYMQLVCIHPYSSSTSTVFVEKAK